MSNEMKCTFSSGPILRCSIYLSDSYFVATLALIRFGWKDIFLFLLFVLFGVYLSISHTKLWYLSTSLGWFPAANCQWFIDLFVWCVYFLYLSLSPTLRSYISLQLSCFFFLLVYLFLLLSLLFGAKNKFDRWKTTNTTMIPIPYVMRQMLGQIDIFRAFQKDVICLRKQCYAKAMHNWVGPAWPETQ